MSEKGCMRLFLKSFYFLSLAPFLEIHSSKTNLRPVRGQIMGSVNKDGVHEGENVI